MEKWGEEKYGRDIEGNGWTRCAISVEKENPIFRWSTMASRFSKTFFSSRGPSEILASLTVATTKKQRRLNFPRNPFNSPRRGELIGTPEPGININDLVVT